MPHVTMIHGISNKPRSDILLATWERALAHDNGLDLATQGITTSMVYWADVLYESPGSTAQMHESTGEEVMVSELDEDTHWRDELSGAEQDFVGVLAEKWQIESSSPAGDDFEAPEGEQDGTFERIPIPWFVKRRLMRVLLKDVHHYLFNTEHTVRQKTYRVQDEIRKRMVETLEKDAASNIGGAHIVVSHSMGTVIAYDCLKRVPNCPQVDGLITIGSPLGIDEIQDKLKPEWTRDSGFPRGKVASEWANVFDRLDVVAALDPKITNDYQFEGQTLVDDIDVKNSGKWRHDITKYLSRKKLRLALAEQLGLSMEVEAG